MIGLGGAAADPTALYQTDSLQLRQGMAYGRRGAVNYLGDLRVDERQISENRKAPGRPKAIRVLVTTL